MGDVLAADFKAKKYLGNLSKPIKTPLEDGLAIIAQTTLGQCGPVESATLVLADLPIWPASGIGGLAWPGMDVQAPYMAPSDDPA